MAFMISCFITYNDSQYLIKNYIVLETEKDLSYYQAY